jgi:hypothetical protein
MSFETLIAQVANRVYASNQRPFNWRTALSLFLGCALALLFAAYLRYGLIEYGPVATHCDAGGSGWRCLLRSAVIQSFIHQRLGWTCLVVAALALVLSSRWLASLALFLACCGLLLYSTALSGPAVLLALLVFIPLQHRANEPVVSKSSST